MATFQTHSARLLSSTPLSELTRHLEFEMTGLSRFGFVPGQWLSFKALQPDGEEITRAYSLASPPGDDARFALCLNRVQDGFMSNFLCDMKPGEEIRCQGPFGDFILRPPLCDAVFIATGTGIAPFRSMLHWLLADESRHQHKQFWLLFGSRHEKDIYYHQEFLRLADQHANFHYLPTLSQGSADWRGLRGYVQGHVSEIAGGRSDMNAYICGLEKMVKSNRELLKSLGWDKKAVRWEKYD
ncbi:MAG TPA: FAD-dependent oxidoreductase [Candidatus Aquilonibacter sp.]|nr:FAD-dependent oxidoreductase [Candidatus Aquilonibacter sp.]